MVTFQSYLRSDSDNYTFNPIYKDTKNFNPTLGLILTQEQRQRQAAEADFNPTLGLILMLKGEVGDNSLLHDFNPTLGLILTGRGCACSAARP